MFGTQRCKGEKRRVEGKVHVLPFSPLLSLHPKIELFINFDDHALLR
jgi:hypothetical protein